MIIPRSYFFAVFVPTKMPSQLVGMAIEDDVLLFISAVDPLLFCSFEVELISWNVL